MSTTGPTPADDVSLPRTAGGFQLLRELGRGGMGVVYEAEELSTGRYVALKVLISDLRGSKEVLTRFHREAHLAASISDSHCVFVYGAYEVEGSPAIAMELVSGGTLEDRLSQGDPIPIDTAIHWTIDVIAGLKAAQQAGVLHRDVKPSNCFLTAEGRVKIGDFGISRLLETPGNLTISGQFLGTPVFASPEQVRGEKVDFRSDLYSVGATLYTLLTGQRPFGAAALGALLTQVATQDPVPPRTVQPAIPRGLEKVVQRAMHKTPAKRYQDYDSLQEALSRFVPSSQAPGALAARVIAFLADCMVVSVLAAQSIPPIFGREDNRGSFLAAIRVAFESRGLPPEAFFDLFVVSWMLVYFVVCETSTGTTIGKWLLGLRVVQGSDHKPSFARATARAGTLLIPVSALAIYLRAIGDQNSLFGNWAFSFLALTPLLLSTIRRRNTHRLLQDFSSGTRVVRHPALFRRFGEGSRVHSPSSVTPASGFPARLGRYDIEGEIGLLPTGAMLRARDPTLGRTVWICAHASDAPAILPKRRAFDRRTRLHSIERFVDGSRHCDVYEDPGGRSLVEARATIGTIHWPIISRTLACLVEEFEAQELSPETRGVQGVEACLEQLWLDRSSNLRILDEPLSKAPSRPVPPLQLIRDAARVMVLGPPTDPRFARFLERLVMPATAPTRRLRPLRTLIATALAALHTACLLVAVSLTNGTIPALVVGALLSALAAIVGLFAFGSSVRSLWSQRRARPKIVAETTLAKAGDDDGSMRMPTSSADIEIPPDVPGYAEAVLRRVLTDAGSFETLTELRKSIDAWRDRPASLSRRVRALQMATAVVLVGACMFLVAFLSGNVSEGERLATLVEELKKNEERATDGTSALLDSLLPEEEVRAREILIGSLSTFPRGQRAIESFDANQVRIQRDAVTRHPSPSREEVTWAKRTLQSALDRRAAMERARDENPAVGLQQGVTTGGLMIGGFWSAMAYAFRGGVTFTVLGVLVRSKRGGRASRGRCALRSFVVWFPFFFLSSMIAGLASVNDVVAISFLWTLTGLLLIGGIFCALWFPSRALQDRVAGTWLVPR